jgi:superfamily II DNA/RNA helicase
MINIFYFSTFKDFLIQDELKKNIKDAGFEFPSDVQRQCLPHSLSGSDVLCQGKAGMGKTAIFIFTIINRILKKEIKGEISCLVLCHTRELAYQISKEFARFSKDLDIKTCLLIGGDNEKNQIQELKNKPVVIIGTPGRILSLTKKKQLNLDNIQVFVIDECDKMLNALDMRADVQKIFKKTPCDKQVMMFTATLPEDTKVVCKKFMRKPVEIIVKEENKEHLEKLQQFYVKLKEEEKNKKLFDILDSVQFNQVIIFVNNIARCETLSDILEKNKFPAVAIHADLPQEERIKKFDRFKDFKTRIMVATELYGRGVDFLKVNFVINYDMSTDAEAYVHRVGRAGRFGSKGITITFLASEDDQKVFDDLLKKYPNIKADVLPEVIDKSIYS